MSIPFALGVTLAAVVGFAGAGCLWIIREAGRRGLDRWLVPYLIDRARRGSRTVGRSGPVHLLLCIADHFEPRNGECLSCRPRDGLQRWVEDYPRSVRRDSATATAGRPGTRSSTRSSSTSPTTSTPLAGLCRRGFGEVEVHLHHDDDTAENLRAPLLAFKEILARAPWSARPRPRDRRTFLRFHPRQLGPG